MKNLWALLIASAVALPAGAFAAALAPMDIQTTFGTGTAFAAADIGGKTYSYVLNADGTAKRTAKGAKTAEMGTWRAADAGYCAKWGRGSEHCYAIEMGTGTQYNVMNASSKVIAHWTK